MADSTLPTPARTIALTAVAMIAFAANSLLCRLALRNMYIDASLFAFVRVASGAAMLSVIMLVVGNTRMVTRADWRSATMLFAYLIFFTYAYLSLSAGTGALILFAAVQLTMFVHALRSGEQFSALSWMGLALAVAGLIYLVFPGLTAPDPFGAVMMAIAGVAWGFYSLLGRGTRDPLAATTGAFLLATPAVLVVTLASVFHLGAAVTGAGVAFAIASGALASGLGYVVWYAALRGLGATSAATVQLSVPAIAALGGVIFLAEELTVRLVIASLATLGGVTIVLLQRSRSSRA
jgi:drug/metabolite transporter (DMT)-like permease